MNALFHKTGNVKRKTGNANCEMRKVGGWRLEVRGETQNANCEMRIANCELRNGKRKT